MSFGAHKESTSRARVLFQEIKLCATRLDRPERDQLKNDCATLARLGVRAVIEEEAKLCTHLLCNKFSVTAKSLGAIVYQKPLVTSSWVHDVRQTVEAISSGEADTLHTMSFPLCTDKYV